MPQARVALNFTAIVFAALCAACVHPAPLTDERILTDLTTRYSTFHDSTNDPDPHHDADLIRPRLGIPLILRAGDPLPLQWIERNGPFSPRAALIRHDLDPPTAARCLNMIDSVPGIPIDGCYPLHIDDPQRAPITHSQMSSVTATARLSYPDKVPAPGSYDLYFDSGHDAPYRAPRAVWLQSDDPAAAREMKIVLLSDPHIGKSVYRLDEHLDQVIAEINHLHPDAVILTGDVTNLGSDPALAPRAAAIFAKIDSPLLVIIGNHDHGFGFSPVFTQAYGPGYFNFSRAFHPMLYFELTLGGYRFIGFDSGPSTGSPSVNNRGIAPETVARIGDSLSAARRDGLRGAVLFSHAASRASLSGHASPHSPGVFGRMQNGGKELERVELAAAQSGLRILSLAGHTHWSELSIARQRGDHLEYELVGDAPAQPGPQRLDTPAAIVTIQSATHPGAFKDSGRGYGYAVITLGAAAPYLEFVRHFDQEPKSAPGDPFTSHNQR